MSRGFWKSLMLSVALTFLFLPCSLGYVDSATATRRTNINLAVASNFYGVLPSNNAITDLIVAFEAANPSYKVTVVDNGATTTLANY